MVRGEEVAIEINGVVRQGFKGHCRSTTCRAAVIFVPLNGRTPPYDLNGESHFITCPEAAKWKNRSKKEPSQPSLLEAP
jgi:hypothetical protein